ncbi:hypothetical protein KCU98_g1621, partial [Aureobasidium melanogenum]
MIDNARGRVTKRPPKPCGKRHHHRAASHIARGKKITTDDYAEPLLLPRRILWCRKGEHHSHPATFLKEAQEELFWQVQHAPEVERFYLLQRRKWYPGTLTEEEKEFLRINPTGRPTFSLPVRSGVSHPVTTTAHVQSESSIEPSQQRQDYKTSKPDRVVVAASVSEKQLSALNSAASRTLTMPLRPGAQRSIKTAPQPTDRHHGFLVLRSQTRIDRANFFGGYQGTRANP